MSALEIEQQIIDGKIYWDKIGQNWFRLIHRASQDVVGNYKWDDYLKRWVAVRNTQGRFLYVGPDDRQNFAEADEARLFIETRVSEQWMEK